MKPQHYIQFGVIIFFISLVCFFFYQKSKVAAEKFENSISVSSLDTSLVDSSLIVTEVDTTPVEITGSWIYEEKPDAMTSGTSYYAAVRANELLIFKPPYDGGSLATLVLRNKSGITNAYLTVDKGQMLIRSYESSSHRVRFDNHPAEWYRFSAPSSGSTTLAFIGNSYDFIEKAKKSKKVLIELEFYQDGLREMEFNISDLKWEH